jgi:exopolysaccharide production protein ExoY
MSKSDEILPALNGANGLLPHAPIRRSERVSPDTVTRTGIVKRAFDVIGSLILLALALPVFLLIALILLFLGGSVFYGHQRIGAGGAPFKCLKFRTMVRNGDQVLAATLASDPVARAEWEAKRKLVNDPRVTRVGRVLRKTSLDELPQLINVLRGDMSLVGPRPIVREEENKYGENLIYYLAVRPGITGLWQVSGRSNTSFEQRVALDRFYVERWSLRDDFLILLRTVAVLLARDGAF